MYFDVKPKTSQEDLFGVSFLLNSLTTAINDRNVRMIVIKGLRRVGKTSLLNVALKGSQIDYVQIDVRESPYYDRGEFLKFLIKQIEEKYSKIKKFFSDTEFKIFYKDMGAGFRLGENRSAFFKLLDRKLKKKGKQLVIAFDEAQLLRKIEFNQMLASIYDNYGQIKIVITGSEIGVLDDFIGKKDAGSPLFGRPYFEIGMIKLEKEKSAEFLEKGFEQINRRIDIKEIEEVIGELDGVIGWLTIYGWFRSQNIGHKNALLKTIEEGKKLAKAELERFLEKRSKANYLLVLKALSKNKSNWLAIKNEFARKGKGTSDRQLSMYLKELADYGFIEKKEEKYRISDPLYIRTIEE